MSGFYPRYNGLGRTGGTLIGLVEGKMIWWVTILAFLFTVFIVMLPFLFFFQKDLLRAALRNIRAALRGSQQRP